MKRAIAFAAAFLFTTVAYAERIGSVETKGMVFKDKLHVEAFDDPDIKGVSCYTTVHDRALSFDDGSSTSLSCRQVGDISGNLSTKRNVFSKNKSIFFKKTVVDRFWDAKRRVLVYLTYTKDVGGSNASNSISVVVVR